MNATVMFINSIVSTIILAIIVYYTHRILQLQYYHYCKSDLIRVIFFNQSPICMHITNILSIVETAGGQVVRRIMDNIISGITYDPARRNVHSVEHSGILGIGIRTVMDVLGQSIFSRTVGAISSVDPAQI
jgi:hypothetical protein